MSPSGDRPDWDPLRPALVEILRDGETGSDADAKEILLVFHCPGCGSGHFYRIKGAPGQPVWTWNGSRSSPTLEPSLLISRDHPEKRCHLFLRNGSLEFLQDCHHGLKGTTVPLEALS